MHIEIHDHTSFREIQELFADFYPWLRLAFYRKGHNLYEASKEDQALSPGMEVGQFKKTHVSGLLEILPAYRVSQVEKELEDRFGLPAQVLRKERNCWVQTRGLDDLTLKELNELSRNESDAYVVQDYEAGFTEPEQKPEKLL